MNAKIMKTITSILMILMLVAITPAVKGQNYVDITEVKINGDIAHNGDDLYVERGDTLNIRVTLNANQDTNHAYLGAYLSGYRYAYYERDMINDYTKTFNLPEGNKRSFDLNLKIPVDIEQKDAKLRLILFDENSGSVITYNYQLSIYGSDDKTAIQIRDFLVSPTNVVEAGKALTFKVRVKNYGNYDIDDARVKVAIPELGIQMYETIDFIEKDETKSFEALYLRIPTTAKPGIYEVVATVEFDRFQAAKVTQKIEVICDAGIGGCAGELIKQEQSTVLMPEAVTLTRGLSSMYPIVIQNKGTTSKTYVLSTTGVSEWGQATFEPGSALIVGAGQSQTVYLKVTPNKETEAQNQIFKVTVTSGDEAKDVTVLAKIEGEAVKKDTSIKKVLEWSLVGLIIVLIILGLIVVFRKMKRNEDSEEEQTYY